MNDIITDPDLEAPETPRTPLEEVMADVIAAYKATEAEIKRLESAKSDIKNNIAGMLERLNLTGIKTASGSATWTAESVTISYDAKALDSLSAANDEYKRILAPFRKESKRAGALMIR